jgi:uncharacterized delta-60 repeat protein
VAIQNDGKIVAVGATYTGGEGSFALARFNPNGSLDQSFSGDGKQTTDFGGGATGVAIQGDGKIVAVGANGHGGFALARYNPNGSLDPSFSGDGKQMTDFGGFDQASGVALQANGKVVVVGQGGPDPSDFAIARYNPNGTLDTSFSGDGKQTTSFSAGCCDGASALAIQGDGKIVAVGLAGGGTGNPGHFALARYNPNGTLDPSFSGDGKQTTEVGDDAFAKGVALQGDGKLVVVGLTHTGGDYGFALARYNQNGTLDPSFSGDGKQTTDFGPFGYATGIALQANGNIVVVGVGRGTDFTYDFALARYLGD